MEENLTGKNIKEIFERLSRIESRLNRIEHMHQLPSTEKTPDGVFFFSEGNGYSLRRWSNSKTIISPHPDEIPHPDDWV